METNESILEGILFAAGEPVGIDRISNVLNVERDAVLQAAQNLAGRYKYEQSGMRIVILDKTLQMVSSPEHADYIRKILEERKAPPLSKAALEVLSLIAYYQPITRADIDKIRGVDSIYTISTVLEKGLIAEAGRLEVVGRPILYKTTPVFLRSFGISSLDELPELSELEGQLTFEIASRSEDEIV